ncbi:diguanylate cyclase [Legionella lansingensis]|uniref:diguanylate cyclase n=1 Tax=Legionella lansingensis TaxID=45067 RepID=A0A0W0VWJ8_9GAMM|nr:GGDEF domain-containing protein [Legionella lansingensis]KTD24297.1 GGDEF domain-containing protein [Legionella lansingensis]SNV51867.1 diguanylate cyclase [Legionella lansingensis]
MMLEQQSKKKTTDTITQYEEQCNRLQSEVDMLRNAIDQLTTLPSGIHLDLDKHLLDLKDALKENKDSKSIQKRIASLVDVMSDLQQQKQDDKIIITDFIKQGADLLSQMLIELKDKHAFERMEQLLKTDADERKLIKHFSKLLTECVTTVAEQIEFCEQHHTLPEKEALLNTRINATLAQMINYIPLPKDLTSKHKFLKSSLGHSLTEESLVSLLEELKQFVITAFGFEQTRTKRFLVEFGNHLRDVGKYLKLLKDSHVFAREDMQRLENDVLLNIQEIENQTNSAKTREELSIEIGAKLTAIRSQVKKYKEIEYRRLAEYEQRMMILQDKLMETERGINEIKNMLSFEKLKNNQDSVTGLPNRVSYEEHIKDAYNRWHRGFGDLSLAVANIDNFKQINDKYGHLAGDKILKEIAMLLKSSIRAVDFLARYNNEEFVFIFEHTHIQDAAKVAEGLRNVIEESVFSYRDKRIYVTVSFGLTNLQHGDDIGSIFMRADEAMLQAKQSGRNRVVTL